MPNTILLQVEARTQSRHFSFALLRKLALLHNPRYGYSYPSLAYLAKDLRASIRTIQRHLAKLEAMGEIIVERVRGRGLNNRYWLAIIGHKPKAQKHDRWYRLKRIFAGNTEQKHDSVGTSVSDQREKRLTGAEQPRSLPDTTAGLWPRYDHPPAPEVAQRWLKNPAAWLQLGESPA
jgi:DNA-binding MarR family transcriptional regulator